MQKNYTTNKIERLDKKRLRVMWFYIFLTISITLMFGYFFYIREYEVVARSFFGFLVGILSMVFVLFLSLYRIRRSIYHYKLGSLHGWFQAHIYIGLISLLLVFLHTGFRSQGFFNGIFYLLFTLVVLSGMVGVLIYSVIPLALAKFGREVHPFEEVLNKFEEYLKDADKVASNASMELQKIYNDKIRPLFMVYKPNWKHLFREERQVVEQAKHTFEELKKEVSKETIYDMNHLDSIYEDRARLSFAYTKMKTVRAWLNLHVPLTVALLTASLVHILLIIYY